MSVLKSLALAFAALWMKQRRQRQGAGMPNRFVLRPQADRCYWQACERAIRKP